MIGGEELAFVRLAMRRRLLKANEVREAVERKRWDAPDRSLPAILVEMGALDPGEAARLRRAVKDDDEGGRPHATMVATDAQADAWRAVAQKTSYKTFGEKVPGGAELIQKALAVK